MTKSTNVSKSYRQIWREASVDGLHCLGEGTNVVVSKPGRGGEVDNNMQGEQHNGNHPHPQHVVPHTTTPPHMWYHTQSMWYIGFVVHQIDLKVVFSLFA